MISYMEYTGLTSHDTPRHLESGLAISLMPYPLPGYVNKKKGRKKKKSDYSFSELARQTALTE